MLKNHKNILYILIAIIVIFFGYWYFVLSKKDTTSNSSTALVAKTSTGATQPGQKSYDREFVASLQAIQYIDLDTSILASPAYQALSFPERPFQVDYNIPVGRRNPFLPIGSDTQVFEVSPAQNQNVNNATTTATTTGPQVLPTPKKR